MSSQPLKSENVSPTFKDLKTIKVYGRGGPNPPKVPMVLEELGLPYEVDLIPFSEVKSPAYTKINPNGRLPSLYDPNTDLTIWESGAIVLYLIDRYDTENKISFPKGSNEAYLAQQWLIYQVSGQGPYYGQSIYFRRYHSEQLPSVTDRFDKEINRVTGVLDKFLSEQDQGADGPWLVGGKFSYADLGFYNWQKMVGVFLPDEQYNEADYPHVKAWIERMDGKASVKKVWEDNMALMAEQAKGGGH